jgi:hypothetical protein
MSAAGAADAGARVESVAEDQLVAFLEVTRTSVVRHTRIAGAGIVACVAPQSRLLRCG